VQRKNTAREKKERPAKRRIVRTKDEVEATNSDDRDSLDKFVTHHGKILPQRATGISAKQQRRIKKTVKQARNKNVI
jgi:ribosomal protein S18